MIPLPAAPNSYHVIAWESFGLCCSLLRISALLRYGFAGVTTSSRGMCFRVVFACLRVWDVSAKCCSGGVCVYMNVCVTDAVRSHRSGVGWGGHGWTRPSAAAGQEELREKEREREMLRSLTMCAGRGWLHTTAGVKDWPSLAEIIKSS